MQTFQKLKTKKKKFRSKLKIFTKKFQDVKQKFDTSNYEGERLQGKIIFIGMMKDELEIEVIKEFACLRLTIYSYKNVNKEKNISKGKQF